MSEGGSGEYIDKCITCKRFKANADTKPLLPYSNSLRDYRVSHIKLLESLMHVINILLLPRGKE